MTLENLRLITPDNSGDEKKNELESCLSEESFIEQLNRVCVLEKASDHAEEQPSRIEYRDITPERMRHGCVVFVGGLGTTAVDYTEQLRILAQQGRRVVYCNPLQGITPSEELATYAKEKGLPPLMACKAGEVLHVMEQLGIEHADVIGHSQGGAVSALVAAFRPEYVGQLILNTPAGIVGEKSYKELVHRVGEEFHAEQAFVERRAAEGDPTYKKAFERNAAAASTDPSYIEWRRRVEIPSIGKTSIIPLLVDIRDRAQNGMPAPEVVLVTAQDDRIFTPEEMDHAIGDVTQGDTLVNRWVMYPDAAVGHGPVEHHVNVVQATHPHYASVLAELLVEHDARQQEAQHDHVETFKEAA